MTLCSCGPESYAYISVFEQVGDFSYLRIVICNVVQFFFSFFLFVQFVYSRFFDTFADLVSGVGFMKNCCFWLLFVLFPILFVFFSLRI